MFGGMSACITCGQFVSEKLESNQSCASCKAVMQQVASLKAPTVVPAPQRLAKHFAQIVPRLYLSDLKAATDEELLRSLQVTHIVDACNVSTGLHLDDVSYCEVNVSDDIKADLTVHFVRTTAFIDAALKNPENSVLVHCAQGISRSCTIVLAYMIYAKCPREMDPDEALAYVCERRSQVRPNPGFWQQLCRYHAGLECAAT